MSELAYQLKKGYVDQASNEKFLSLLHSSHRIESIKDKQIVPSIPLSSFNPTELPSIQKEKIKLKNRSSSQTKIKPLKQIKPQTKRNINRQLSQHDGLQGASITKQSRNHSSQSSRKGLPKASGSYKKIHFTPKQKQKQMILQTTAVKTNKGTITKLSSNITLEQVQNQKVSILLNLKFGKIQQNISYKAFIKRETRPPPQQIVAKLNSWASRFKIKSGLIETDHLEQVFQRKSISHHLILSQFSNYSQLKSEYQNIIPGLKYYDKKKPIKGLNLAASKITSLFRMNLEKKYAMKLKSLMKKVKVIQRYWRTSLQYQRTRQKMYKNISNKIQRANTLSQQMIGNWQLIRNSPHFQIHVCSFSLEEFKRLSIQKIREKQNIQITRIFRVLNPDVKVIYITPYQIPTETIRYYERLLKLNSPLSEINNRIFFVDLEESTKVQHFQYLSTTSMLLYSPKALKKIKNILHFHQENLLQCCQSFIVPSYPSNQYINLSAELNVPLFSFSQSLAKLYSTKSGFHQLFKQIGTQKKPYKMLKTVQNLYSETEVINSLAVLLYKHKHVDQWYFKIDDEIQSRGLALFSANSINLIRQIRRSQEQADEKQMIKLIAGELALKLKKRLKILRKDIYKNYHQYITNFVTRGGIIEASPTNKTQEHSISFFIEPNGDFRILTTYSKLVIAGKTINSAIKCPSNVDVLELDSEKIVVSLYRHFWTKNKLFGYFTIDFLYDPKTKQAYAIGLDCFLNSKTASIFIPKVTSFAEYNKEENKMQANDPLNETQNNELHYLYYPIMILDDLPQIPKFFKACNLNNISFDLQKKLGTIFLLTGQIENGCIGFMTLSNSVQHLLEQTQRIVEYLSKEYKCQGGQLGGLRGILVNWLRKIKHLMVPKQQINLSLIF